MKNTVDIKFVEDGCVEITLEESRFRLVIDEHGSPKFPDSLKETLPPYLPEMVERWVKSKLQNPSQSPIHLAVSHRPWCREIGGAGGCNCNPDLRYLETREYREISGEKLTCRMCKESSTGEIRFDVVRGASRNSWERFWIEGGDMFYWLVAIGGFDFRVLICHLCMIDRTIQFPNPIEWTRIRGMTSTEVRKMDWNMEEDEATQDPKSFKKLSEAQNGSYPKKGRNELAEDKQRKLEVKIKDKFVELERRDGQSMFIFAIDERGLPYFPERVKGKLPSYVTELAQKTIHHKLWCVEIEGLGIMCDCADPMAETSEDGKIACKWGECGNLSTQKTGLQNTIGKAYSGFWTNDSGRLYWLVGPDPTGTIICGDCLKDFLEVDFSHINDNCDD
jgi:hypothetical protein